KLLGCRCFAVYYPPEWRYIFYRFTSLQLLKRMLSHYPEEYSRGNGTGILRPIFSRKVLPHLLQSCRTSFRNVLHILFHNSRGSYQHLCTFWYICKLLVSYFYFMCCCGVQLLSPGLSFVSH